MGTMDQKPLRIEVAPDIVEELGLNLYTSLPRVLVEFVANAYDADSPCAKVTIDSDGIRAARNLIREQWREGDGNRPLEEWTLPPALQIVVEDQGHGMTRDEIQEKFLRIGRKRRKLEKTGDRSPKGRPVMGRKGIGKLAGFGVARRVEVVTKPVSQPYAVRIVLDYDKLIGHQTTENIEVEEETIEGGSGLNPSGTRVVLTHLAFEPAGARLDTIERQIARHFAIVKGDEFSIQLNEKTVPPFRREYAFAFPKEDRPVNDLIPHKIDVAGRNFELRYRLRFTHRRKQLSAADRGVRIYARQRLAAAPSLLDLKTGIHGFQNSHYLDGEVHADFIDEQRADYIASGRQELRWDTPILDKLRIFLTKEMEEACKAYQNTKEKTLAKRVEEDDFTRQTINEADLPRHRRTIAFRIAAKLAAGSPEETADEYYRETLPVIARGLGYGELMAAIAEIARADHPSFSELVKALASLTKVEWDDYNKIVSARLKGVEALRRLCEAAEFRAPNNEDDLHALLKKNPWLIDATFWVFLTSNVAEKTLSERLTKHLKIDRHIPEDYDKSSPKEVEPLQTNRRPDLTFLLSNYALQRVVIVELKAPNTPLHIDHLLQLESYMEGTEDFLKSFSPRKELKVEGFLIGSRAPQDSNGEKIKLLRRRERESGPETPWQVFDISELLSRAVDVHRELLDVYEQATETGAAED